MDSSRSFAARPHPAHASNAGVTHPSSDRAAEAIRRPEDAIDRRQRSPEAAHTAAIAEERREVDRADGMLADVQRQQHRQQNGVRAVRLGHRHLQALVASVGANLSRSHGPIGAAHRDMTGVSARREALHRVSHVRTPESSLIHATCCHAIHDDLRHAVGGV